MLPRTRLRKPLAAYPRPSDDPGVEPLINHRDVTTIMGLLADIQADVRHIRNLLENEDGEEETPEDDT